MIDKIGVRFVVDYDTEKELWHAYSHQSEMEWETWADDLERLWELAYPYIELDFEAGGTPPKESEK